MKNNLSILFIILFSVFFLSACTTSSISNDSNLESSNSQEDLSNQEEILEDSEEIIDYASLSEYERYVRFYAEFSCRVAEAREEGNQEEIDRVNIEESALIAEKYNLNVELARELGLRYEEENQTQVMTDGMNAMLEICPETYNRLFNR